MLVSEETSLVDISKLSNIEEILDYFLYVHSYILYCMYYVIFRYLLYKMFTRDEKVDMIMCYGEARQNTTQARRLYAEKFPERECPSRITFHNVKLFCRTGSVEISKKVRRNIQTGVENEVTVLAAVAVNPRVSCRQISKDCGISVSSVLRILHRHKFHPYHMSLHQALEYNDAQNRVNFCHWAQQKIQNNGQFFTKVLFSDKSTFTNHGQVNTHNMHYWSEQNPRWYRQVVHQRPWSINVWCGIWNDQIIGPYFIDGNLNGEKYNNFLNEALPELLENIPLINRLDMWYQHDGCPTHFTRIVRDTLNNKFPEKWIGRGSRVNWPARSPDLTPLDFFYGAQ